MRPIDADRLKESVHAFGIRGAGWGDDERESDVCNMIDNEPTIDAAPVVHARWIDQSSNGSLWRCSACGWLENFTIARGLNYCPHCGARMDADHIGDITQMVDADAPERAGKDGRE